EILTMVGSLDYFKTEIDGQVNMAIAERQPGSAFKPFNYITAFAKGYSPATMLLDIPSSFPNGSRPPYQPLDIDKKFRGPVSVRQALAQSLNVPAVRTLAFAGVKDVIDTAHKMGITSLDRDGQYGLSLTLGGGEVKLLDMVYAYGVLANGGVMAGTPVSTDKQRSGYRTLDPVAILKVEGPQGNILEEYTTPQTKPVVSAQLAYLITDILSDNDARAPIFGSNSPLKLPDRPAAVKTGTTEDWTDNWTIGYTPDLVTGVWIGNANYESMYQVLGVTAAGPIWHNFMVAAHQGIPAHRFPVPPGLVKAPICVPSGLQPTPQCPTTREEIFIQGTEPKQKDNMYQLVRIDKRTGNLATPQTPPQFIEEKVFMVLPPEAQEWALQNNIPQPPASSSAVERR
ncbi:MAG: penicillin-binding protein, partial [Chloroflexi bacterium]|nr:penicillin-binding protein [Chloroflexota bacterium]